MPNYVDGTAWTYWITTANTSTATTNVWDSWTQGTAQTTTPTAAYVWNSWMSTTTNVLTYDAAGANWPPRGLLHDQPETAEVAAHREDRIWAERHRAELREAAQKKARALLLEVLDDEQRQTYEAEERFRVHARTHSGPRSFEIVRGRAGNVFELDEDGQRVSRICGHLYDGSPDEDTMVAQKLMLETDPDEFLRVANVTRLMHRAA